MIHSRSLTKTAVIAVFFLILALPALQMRTHAFSIVPLNENRKRAAGPGRLKIRDLPRYLEKSRDWFDDNYGFRDLLIRAKTQLDFSLFHVSDRIYIGTNGWLFYRSVIDIQEPAVEALTDLDLAKAIGNVKRLRDYLAMRGIKLIIVTNQLKAKFYPEYLPESAAKARKFHRFDDFRSLLHAVQGISYVDTTDELMALKQRRPIFHKTDFHWNDPAAFEIAGILVNLIAGEEHRGDIVWHYPLKIETKKLSGGQAMFMPLFHPPEEYALFVVSTWTSPLAYNNKPPPPFEWSSRAAPGGGNLLPTTVLFGDSFADGMVRSGLADYFHEFYRVRTGAATLPDVLSKLPPGTHYFIYQSIDLGLTQIVNMPEF